MKNIYREKQVNLLIIPDRQGWCYIAVKALPALLRGITSNATVILIAWIVLILSQQKKNLNHVQKYVKIMICDVVMLSEDTKV